MTKDPTTEFAPGAGKPQAAAGPVAPGGGGRQWFGHPAGLSTLFFTELWERFSYYGMRAILVLFMAASLSEGGLDFGDGKAAAIYGMYTGFVYLMALPGGWVADNLWGQRKSVFVGGCIIALGHFTMAMPAFDLPEQPFFFAGLILIVVGTGLLKPNVSTIVGELYPEGGARRDAGFSVFYTGINLGAFAGPLICGYLGENVNWHWGFSAAGFGMVLGLIQYKLGESRLGTAGLLASGDSSEVTARKARNFYLATAVAAGGLVTFVFLATSGLLSVSLQQVATWLGYMILLLVILFFAYLIMGVAWAVGFAVLFAVIVPVLQAAGGYEIDAAGQWAVVATLAIFILANLALLVIRRGSGGVSLEKRRLMVIFWLFLLAALFWSGFEQAGSSLNLFAERETDRLYFAAADETVADLDASYLILQEARSEGDLEEEELADLEASFGAAQAEAEAELAPAVYQARMEAIRAVEAAHAELQAEASEADPDEARLDELQEAYEEASEAADFGWQMPASWLQSINPLFIITLAPVFGALWIWLARRNANPSIPLKFALGLLGLAAGFFVISWGAANAGGDLASPTWLVVTYFLHTCGELCLSPVGLSSITKLAPRSRVGQMMGIWFIGAALGNLIAGLLAGQLENLEAQALFGQVAMIVGVGGLVALLLSPFVRKLMGDVE